MLFSCFLFCRRLSRSFFGGFSSSFCRSSRSFFGRFFLSSFSSKLLSFSFLSSFSSDAVCFLFFRTSLERRSLFFFRLNRIIFDQACDGFCRLCAHTDPVLDTFVL